jgi:hypothetical protein
VPLQVNLTLQITCVVEYDSCVIFGMYLGELGDEIDHRS